MRALVLVALSLLGVSLTACGPNPVGEACAYPNETTDCEEGAICTQDIGVPPPEGYSPTWASYTCRVDCTNGQACEAGFVCRPNIAREMLSSCQPVD